MYYTLTGCIPLAVGYGEVGDETKKGENTQQGNILLNKITFPKHFRANQIG